MDFQPPNPPLSSRDQFASLGEKLLPYEASWRDRQPFLQSRGYQLRKRYHQDWVPTWREQPEIYPPDAEDFWALPVSRVSSATCLTYAVLVSSKPD